MLSIVSSMKLATGYYDHVKSVENYLKVVFLCLSVSTHRVVKSGCFPPPFENVQPCTQIYHQFPDLCFVHLFIIVCSSPFRRPWIRPSLPGTGYNLLEKAKSWRITRLHKHCKHFYFYNIFCHGTRLTELYERNAIVNTLYVVVLLLVYST